MALAALPTLASAQGKALKLFKGTVTNAKTGAPIDGGRLLVFEGSGSEPTIRSRVNPGTGAYQVVLDPGKEYHIRVISPRYYTVDIPVTTTPGSNYEETVKNLALEPIPIGLMLFTGRMFEPGSSKLVESPALRSVVETLKKETGIVVTITVVPDMLAASAKKAPAPKKKGKGKKGAPATAEPAAEVPSGLTTADQLKKLGEERAAVVKNLLKQQGISTTRLVWDIKPGVELQPPPSRGKFAGYPDNVILKITALQEPEDSDS